MPSPRRSRPRPGLILTVFLTALAVAAVVAGPRIIRAHAALEWTRYHAAQAPDVAGQHAAEVARWATRTLGESAPLPWGAEACSLALEFGARQESSNPAAARALYDRLRASLESARSSRWRGLGLADLLEEARRREDELRAGPAATPPSP